MVEKEMNNEIKEILDRLEYDKNDVYYIGYTNGVNIDNELMPKDIKLLLDYITNLQQENERLKEKIKYVTDKLVGYINTSCVITNEYFEDIIRTIEENTDIQIGTNCMNLIDDLEDYKSRCEKAVEYLKEHSQMTDINIYGIENVLSFRGSVDELLNILNGRSDE